jgi:dedicator of cytokinesis protein 3
MLQKHPSAELIDTTDEPNDSIKFGAQPYIQVTPVNPEPDRSAAIFTNLNVPNQVRAYYEHK